MRQYQTSNMPFGWSSHLTLKYAKISAKNILCCAVFCLPPTWIMHLISRNLKYNASLEKKGSDLLVRCIFISLKQA